MRTTAVESSYIQSLKYDERSKTIRVRFTDGAVIDYFDVFSRTYKAILSADSVGEAFIRLVRDKHKFVVVKTAA
jgi:hypothetical protein